MTNDRVLLENAKTEALAKLSEEISNQIKTLKSEAAPTPKSKARGRKTSQKGAFKPFLRS